MPSLKDVQNKISAVKKTKQITKAMNMVATSRLRGAQTNMQNFRPYAAKFSEVLGSLAEKSGDEASPLLMPRDEVKKIHVVLCTSDRGLCGAFNSNIFKRVIMLVEENYKGFYERGYLDILPIGRKSYDFFRKREFNIIDQYWELYTDMTYDKVKEVAEFTMQSFKNKHYDEVIVVYNEFKNVATQILQTYKFLPIESNVYEETKQTHLDYIFEPSQQYIIRELIPQSLHIQFYKAILESIAAEHGARMTAMEQATENADELLGELQITYNRTRQAVITKELNEIVGGAQALSQD